MVAKRHRARWDILLPLAALTLLLPMQRASATHMGHMDMPMPNRDQVRHYKMGLEAWEVALNESDRRERLELLEKAARHMSHAASGPGEFPEALLSLALVRYTQNNIIEAEPVFEQVAKTTKGAMRAEALTYLGLISLRSHKWEQAKARFEASMEESLDNTTTSANRKQREEVQEALRERLGRLDCVARVGSVLASFYMARDPRTSPPTEADYRALLSEIDRLLPEGKGKDMVQKCQSAFNGTDAAIWRFPSPPPDWRPNLLDGVPSGVRAISLMEFITAMRVWAGAELAFEPPLPVPPAEGMTEQDRHNVAAGLLRRVLRLEAAGNFAEALPVWVELSNFPETAMAARQHRIWILLHRPNGQNAPSQANINAARELIRGRLAAEDPLLFEEQLALASAIMYSATGGGDQMRATFETARAEFRLVLTGIPGVPNRTAPEYVRRIAEWNLAVLAVALPETMDPAYWERGLADFPQLPGRERIRLYMAMRLAEAYMMARQPAQVERALALAERIARGQEGPGSLSVPNSEEQLRLFRRYLAKLAIQTNQLEAFRSGFLRNTDFAGEFRAFDATEVFRAFVRDLQARPGAIVDAPSVFQRILSALQDARSLAGGNTALQQRLDQDIRSVQAYLQALEANPPRIFFPWNEAANRTNTAKTAADWDAAAQAWRNVLGLLQGRPAADRAEAAMHVINAYMKKADVLFRSGDKDGARAALEQARDALGVGPNGVGSYVTPEDRTMTQRRIENNLKALSAGEETLVPPAPGRIPPYRGGMIGPCPFRCMIMHYDRPHPADVADWLNRLQNDQDALKRLVDWFNNGPMAKAAPDAKRDFSTDPNSPNYLVAFLSKHMNRTPGVLKRGTLQWCDHMGAGPWKSAPVRADGAAYYLNNGVAIINAECSNPLAPIRTRKLPAPEWQECPESAAPRPFPPYPVLSYGMPEAEFSFHVEGIFQPYALPLPAVVPVPIIPPAITVLSVPEVMPKLAIPSGC
jgi:hypothetical protein